MNFFKKLGGQISNPFKKGGAVQSAFKKGGQISRGLSTGLNQASKVLGQVGKVGSDILNNPVVSGALLATAPELYLPAQGLIQGSKALSGVAKGASNLTDTSTYKGGANLKGVLENVADAKKRFNMVSQDAQAVNFV